MQELFPQDCLKVYRPELANKGIVVVLPSFGNKYIPYFTRAKWHHLFPDKCFIACADPSLKIYGETLNGTWFLDEVKGSRLIGLADWLSWFINTKVGKEKKKPNVVFCGSSMGGYASIYMATLFKNSYAFAECPQTNLQHYRGSAKALDHILGANSASFEEHWNLSKQFKKTKRIPNAHILLPLTDVLHYRKHVVPYARAVGAYLREKKEEEGYFKVSIEHSHLMPFGHAPVDKQSFKEHIDKIFFQMESENFHKSSLKEKLMTYARQFISRF